MIIATALGVPLGVLLQTTKKGGILEAPALNKAVGGVVNAVRSIPFIILLIFLIPLTWVVFALPNMQDIATYFSRLFPFFADNTASFVNTKDVIRALHDYWYLLIACVVFCLPFPSRWYEKHKNSKLVILGLVLIYLMSVYKMQTQTSNPFLYYQF